MKLFMVMMLGFAACAAAPSALTIRERAHEVEQPVQMPEGMEGAPQLVAYPGSEVALVSNAPDEVYEFDGIYYCFLHGNWFHAYALNGPWIFTEMKKIPVDLFQVRGSLPPGVRR